MTPRSTSDNQWSGVVKSELELEPIKPLAFGMYPLVLDLGKLICQVIQQDHPINQPTNQLLITKLLGIPLQIHKLTLVGCITTQRQDPDHFARDQGRSFLKLTLFRLQHSHLKVFKCQQSTDSQQSTVVTVPVSVESQSSILNHKRILPSYRTYS